MKAEKNAVLDQQIHDMQVTVAEMRHIYQAAGNKTVILIPMQRSKMLFFLKLLLTDGMALSLFSIRGKPGS